MAKNKGGITDLVVDKTKNKLKNERIAYKGAFLTSVRERLLPLHQRGAIDSLRSEEENDVLREIYDEVNDLFIDEHWMMANGDLLEQ